MPHQPGQAGLSAVPSRRPGGGRGQPRNPGQPSPPQFTKRGTDFQPSPQHLPRTALHCPAALFSCDRTLWGSGINVIIQQVKLSDQETCPGHTVSKWRVQGSNSGPCPPRPRGHWQASLDSWPGRNCPLSLLSLGHLVCLRILITHSALVTPSSPTPGSQPHL